MNWYGFLPEPIIGTGKFQSISLNSFSRMPSRPGPMMRRGRNSEICMPRLRHSAASSSVFCFDQPYSPSGATGCSSVIGWVTVWP